MALSYSDNSDPEDKIERISRKQKIQMFYFSCLQTSKSESFIYNEIPIYSQQWQNNCFIFNQGKEKKQ